jgi:amidohydrolase
LFDGGRVPLARKHYQARIVRKLRPVEQALRADLIALSREIHANPELAYQEFKAVAAIERLLRKYGHAMERPYGGLETAFRSRIGPQTGPFVALLAEYDALPDVGHGCGHNLIAMSTVGAYLLAAQQATDLKLGIELIGTPAEESGGGKLDLLDAGVFEGCVAVLSSHPGGNWWGVGQTTLGIINLKIAFHGLASHAAVSPEKGKNALSAAISMFTAIDAWRQHLPSDARVHGIITNGGAAANIIPSYAEAVIGLRSVDVDVLREMVAHFRTLCDAAAAMHRCTVEVTEEMRLYEPTTPDPALTDLLVKELERLGAKDVRHGNLVTASTDLGNISQRYPTTAIGFPVSTESVPGHSIKMTEASVSEFAHNAAATTAEALGATATQQATTQRR